MPRPHSVVGWSAVCDGGISWSYLLAFLEQDLTRPQQNDNK